MICTNCKEYNIFLMHEEFVVKKYPRESEMTKKILSKYFVKANDDLICKGCGCKIVKDEYYFYGNEFERYAIEYIADKVQGGIECCTECGQGEDIQMMKMSFEKCFADEYDNPQEEFEKYGTASTIEDIIQEITDGLSEDWEQYYDSIAENVECPSCGNGSGVDYDEKINYGYFDRYTEVYTSQDISEFNHNFYGDKMNDIHTQVDMLAEKFTFSELVELKNKYISNPMFAPQEPVFKRLVDFLTDLFIEGEWYILSENRMLFRTRTSKIGNNLHIDDLWAPPFGYASHGRYNNVGYSVLYCSNNRDVVKQEIALEVGEQHNIGKLVTKKSMRLFPVNYIFNGEFDGLINEEVPKNQHNLSLKKQYILSNIVAAICENIGYDGIVYHSIKDRKSINYALFGKVCPRVDIDILDVEY